MQEISNHEIYVVFQGYPRPIRKKLMQLRALILETASELGVIDQLEETLKWGEPSFLSREGSAIRIHWKESAPDQYAMYFHCKTRLVDTFKELYKEVFSFEKNRAIVFAKNENIPFIELKHCIQLALTYHSRKKLPLLGAWDKIG